MARSKCVKVMRSCVQISGRGASGQKQPPRWLEHTEQGHRERGLDKGQDSGFYTEQEGKTQVPLRRAVPQSDAFPKDHLAASRSQGWKPEQRSEGKRRNPDGRRGELATEQEHWKWYQMVRFSICCENRTVSPDRLDVGVGRRGIQDGSGGLIHEC